VYEDPTIIAIIAIAVFGPIAILALGARAAWRAWRRRRARRQSVEAFLAELKTDAAWAAVTGHYAYAGADVLQMLREHLLLDQREYDALIASASERDEREARETACRPAFAGALDDEIPF
jgi:hypothetical protein